jgi:glycosyltransferase involved in cell wall biosynthesis
MKIWVVIPAYNEGETLEAILKELKRRALPTVVVDDGSRDGTLEVANRHADRVIKNEKNFDKGMALKEGISFLLKNDNFDYIITMDADGQHSPLDIENFLREAQRGENFVLGNRMGNHLGMPKIRVFTNMFMSWLISGMLGQKIPDTQCGFRLIKREVLEKIKVKTNKFEIDSEILIKAVRAGFNIKSIPIQSIYFKNQRSKIHPFVDTFRFIRFLLHLGNERG